MALDKDTLKVSIVAMMIAQTTKEDKASAIQDFAEGLATAIHLYVKTATVTTVVSTSAGAGTGTGTLS